MPRYTALSIVAPHGENIASGRKSIEVRRWQPAATLLPLRNLMVVENGIYLTEPDPSDPDGHAVALVDVVLVEPWQRSQVVQACSSGWAAGYFAWHLANVRPLKVRPRTFAERGLYEISLENELGFAEA